VGSGRHRKQRAKRAAQQLELLLPILLLAALLSACGGGGGGSAPVVTTPPTTPVDPYTPGVFAAASMFKDLCATPRSGSQYPDLQGSRTDENNWLRSWSNELYLWYDEIIDRNPASFATDVYFDLLKTEQLTASGADKDRFHFSLPTDEWEALSQSGVSAGYGAYFDIIAPAPPRKIVIAYVDAGTPAASAGLVRGDEVVAINGADVATTSNVDLLNDALFPADEGESYTFTVRTTGATTTRSITLVAEFVTADPVNVVNILNTASGPVGYLSFTSNIATSEAELISAIQQLAAADVTDLILDLRYNSGGFLDIANELAYMIAGPAAGGRIFDEIQFSDKHTLRNPVTGQILEPDYFLNTTQGFSAAPGEPLPVLDIEQVFVLTGPATCSASETIINGLRGIDINVVQIGDTTCGKPYGFYPFDNCGTTYFTIQFKGVNAKGFGDYTDGFSPANIATVQGTPVPGCLVADDFSRPLGDAAEARIAAALGYRDSGSCPALPGATIGGLQFRKSAAESADAIFRPAFPGLVKEPQ